MPVKQTSSDRKMMRTLVKAYHQYSGTRSSFARITNITVHKLDYWIQQFPDLKPVIKEDSSSQIGLGLDQVKSSTKDVSDFISIPCDTPKEPSVDTLKDWSSNGQESSPSFIKILLPNGTCIEIPFV